MRIGVYPGTFDPITLGHMDIIRRGIRLVDKLVIGVTTNPSKSPMFSDEERLEMVRRETAYLGDMVEVIGFNALLMKFAEKQGASVIVRGLRAVADFEYEFQLANMNRAMYSEFESVFLTPSEHLSYISSSLVREIAALDGDITPFVPPCVAEALTQKFQH